MRRVGCLILAAFGVIGAPGVAFAGEATGAAAEQKAVILPTVIVKAPSSKAAPSDAAVAELAATLDAGLSDAAQDLGLVVDLGRHAGARRVSDIELVEQAQASGGDLVAPTLERRSANEVEVRIAMARAGRRVVRTRVERVSFEDAPVRAVVMLRDLVNDAATGATAPGPPQASYSGALATPARSAGRAMLAVNATLYGGLVGFSIQRAAGSDDPRLLYPLLAVGAGIGLGGSIIVAEEWDVGVGDAWYLSAGAWWPTLAGHLLYEGRFAQNEANTDARWTFGLVGGLTGVTLATLGLTLHGMGEGGAMLAHSGGGLGLVLGGLAELGQKGDVHKTPFTGMGYGAGIGWLAAAALATQVEAPTGRVLAVDLGAFLGGLGGAALASPLLFDTKPTKERGWVGATAGAAVLGMGIAWYLSRDSAAAKHAEAPLVHTPFVEAGLPSIDLLGESVVGSAREPILGLSWRGVLLR